jgi:hypothetical protein
MTLRRICIPFFFFTAESAMPLLSRKKIPFSCPDSTLWVAQQGPGLRLSGCSESKQLFAYPEVNEELGITYGDFCHHWTISGSLTLNCTS